MRKKADISSGRLHDLEILHKSLLNIMHTGKISSPNVLLFWISPNTARRVNLPCNSMSSKGFFV